MNKNFVQAWAQFFYDFLSFLQVKSIPKKYVAGLLEQTIGQKAEKKAHSNHHLWMNEKIIIYYLWNEWIVQYEEVWAHHPNRPLQ